MAYKSAFLIPAGSDKELTGTGWVFPTGARLSPTVLSFLRKSLAMDLADDKIGMQRFVATDIQATVLYDDKNLIEHVYFQAKGEGMARLKAAFASSALHEEAELFLPSDA